MKSNRASLRPLLWALAAFVLGAAFAGNFFRLKVAPAAQDRRRNKVMYQCPMHPQIVQDHPGFCPICHMRLEKVEDGEDSGAGAPPAQAKITRYRNPMDPTIFSDHPMKDSMGMDYIPVTADEDGDEAGQVAGKGGFTLSPERQQLIGVRTTAVAVQPVALTLRMPGRGAPGGRVWAQLLEIDAGTLKVGMKAQVLGPNGESAEARVTRVDNTVDNLTHSFGAALRTTSPAAWLSPGLFCQVLVDAGLGKHLAVPQEAVLDTGERQVVFVENDRGHFEPRQVVLGEAGDDLVEIKRGVEAGEQVVTSANFLIDSESRFRAALNQFQRGLP